jgi:hypothetical protein
MKSTLQILNLQPAARLAYVPTEAEIIARLRKSKDPADKEEADTREASWLAWVEDTKLRGVIEPVKVIKLSLSLWEVVDGRNRLAAAKAAGLKEIPAVEVAEADVNGLIISTRAHRKGVTKGSIAYLALTLHSYLVGRGKGKKEKRSDCAYNSLAELAGAIGVGERTMDDAAATLLYLKDHPAEKTRLEPAIIAGLIDLNSARAGAGGAAETRGKPRRPSSYASATKTLRSLSSQLREVEAWKEEDRAAALTAFRNAFTGLNPAARAILLESLTEEGGAS